MSAPPVSGSPAPAAPSHRLPGADLRRSILDHARHLLVAEGYVNLSMRKIARAVGCSATSIYLHFESKDALTHALIDEGMERLFEALGTAEAGLGDPLARLDALSRAYVRFGLEHPEYYQIMFQLHPARMARYPAENYRRARRNIGRFARALADAEGVGVASAAPSPDVAAGVLWAALHGVVSLLLAERVDARIADEGFIDAAVVHAIAGFRVGPLAA